MTRFQLNPEGLPTSLSPEETRILDGLAYQGELQGVQSLPTDIGALNRMLDTMLEEAAPRVDLNLCPTGETITLRIEDKHLVRFMIVPWTDDLDRSSEVPLLARVLSDESSLIEDTVAGDIFVVHGASIGKYQRRGTQDLGTLALSCNFCYANASRKLYDRQADTRTPDIIDRMAELGITGYVNGVHMETTISLVRKFTPSIIGIQIG